MKNCLRFCPGYIDPNLYLVFSESEFEEIVRSMGASLTSVDEWAPQNGARAHEFFSEDQGLEFVICLNLLPSVTAIKIAGIIVHESVHVWQKYCQHIGERVKGSEQEAYFIQNCSEALLTEYARRKC